MASTKKIIFYADDEPSVLMGMSIILERMGYDVMPVENGLEVLDLLKIITPDVIALDLNMPVLDGMETLKQIKNDENYAHIPIIMISGALNAEEIKKLSEFGCSNYLAKPIDVTELNKVLEKCVFPHGRRKHLRSDLDITVNVKFSGASQTLFTKSISENGIFIRATNPFPVDSEVEIALPVDDETISLKGVVIYRKTHEGGNSASFRQGMAVEFKDVSERDSVRLKVFVSKLIIRGVSKDGKVF